MDLLDLIMTFVLLGLVCNIAALWLQFKKTENKEALFMSGECDECGHHCLECICNEPKKS